MNLSKSQIYIVAVVAVTSFMGTFLISSINIALPAIEKSFNLDAVTLSWVITSFLLATAMFLLPVGKLGDVKGIKRFFKIGVIIFTISSFLCGFSVSGLWLIVFRYLQGIGTAFVTTTGPAILVSAFPQKYRGRVLGISVSAVYLGLAFGPFAGGFITQFMGWRSIFYISALLGIFTTLLTFLFLGKDESAKTEYQKIEFKESIWYMIGLLLLTYGSSKIPLFQGWIMFAAGLLSVVIFWRIENNSDYPVIDTRLFTQNRLFAYSNLAALINYSATFAIVFLLSLYLQKLKGFSPSYAGTLLVAQPLMMTIFSPFAGTLSDKLQPRYLTTIGMTMCTIGLAIFALFSESTPVWLIITMLLWVGLGFALFSSPNMNTIMSSVNNSQYGLASGSAATMRVIGQITSMTIAALFFSFMFNGKAIEMVSNTVFLKAMKYSFICFSAISALGIYFSFNRGKIEREKYY
ncbi:MAG: MFS transporter [Melioribacteraceae bacterium]|nr:MFS transporter [Melioribacteraceae bacterium]